MIYPRSQNRLVWVYPGKAKKKEKKKEKRNERREMREDKKGGS